MSLINTNNYTASTSDLRQRVISCLNKLSDRDTLAVATTELESIARNLTHDAFSPFLNCLSATDSSEKSPVRRQCVRLLGLLSAAHGDALSPHLSKMLSAVVLRRLRDSDSAVRSACIDAVASMASRITKPPFCSFLKPLVEAILHEQDCNSQIGSSMCLAAAIEASPDPEPAQLQKLLPKFLKLVKNDCFKAKPALLSLIGSIASVGGASNLNVLSTLVPSLFEFLSSEDWAARKATAEALAKLAVAERDLLSDVRAVEEDSRDFERVSPESNYKSASKDDGGVGCSPLVSRSFCNGNFETPKPKKTTPASRTPSSHNSCATVALERCPSKSSDKKPSKLDFRKKSDWNVEIAVPQPSSLQVVCEDDLKHMNIGVVGSGVNGSSRNLRSETKRVLFTKTSDEKLHKFGGLRSGSRVVPFHENDNCDSIVVQRGATEDVDINQKEVEDLNLIQKQLVQIENQQSSLLDLLQWFIGSSQSGMNSLETRVDGLEKALDEISYDLAVSTGRISNTNSAGNSCCMLPGAEFLSPKFWRRTEGQHTSSRFSFSGRDSLPATRSMSNKNANAEMPKLDSPKDQCQSWGRFAVCPLADTYRNLRGNIESCSGKNSKKITQDTEKVNAYSAGGLDETSRPNCIAAGNLSSR
ncbi:ARM repeat superfamily protein [Actinidia rufa]|uniref:ARM repeat superfamily protein n=1 Tax=Actinidia rufa TaxID=165716 RepID=A0A7J0EQ93_9ERIC|nr:ARM repeat superfamily protein [Actinidia rufa]